MFQHIFYSRAPCVCVCSRFSLEIAASMFCGDTAYCSFGLDADEIEPCVDQQNDKKKLSNSAALSAMHHKDFRRVQYTNSKECCVLRKIITNSNCSAPHPAKRRPRHRPSRELVSCASSCVGHCFHSKGGLLTLKKGRPTIRNIRQDLFNYHETVFL